jgi:hypothetical protein
MALGPHLLEKATECMPHLLVSSMLRLLAVRVLRQSLPDGPTTNVLLELTCFCTAYSCRLD